jgi:hypothetical protein
MERLDALADGRLRYRLKRPWRDGTTHVIYQPLELLEKLAALVPAPKAHLIRYSGVLAPAAKWRASVVPATAAESASAIVSVTESCTRESSAALSVETRFGAAASAASHGRNYTWAELMKRVWALDVLEGPRCRGRMRILAAIHPPDASQKILASLGLPSRGPPTAPATREFDLHIEPF